MGLEVGRRYELRVTAYNSAGATTADYTVTTPHADGEFLIRCDARVPTKLRHPDIEQSIFDPLNTQQ